MAKTTGAIVLAGVLALVSAPLAFGQPLTDAEFKCQAKVSKAAAKFVDKKAKCASKCLQDFWKGKHSNEADCLAPYGGSTAECIDDTVTDKKGAEDKFRDAILKSCDPGTKSNTDCPECYSGGDCSTSGEATNRVQDIEGQVDSFGPGVFCERAGATKEEQKCQLNTAKTLAKHVKGINKCYDKCFSNARKGKIDEATCAPPASDPATAECVNKADGKSIAKIDKKCADIGASPDNCGGPYPDGASWVNLVDIAITGNVPGTYCGSPSGAFVD